MRSVVQRVTRAEVRVDSTVCGAINSGLLVLLGVGRQDTSQDADYLLNKIIGLRIFEDDAGKMNLSLTDTGGELLVVSQFTLYGDTRKGRRPSFDDAAPPERARELYEYFVEQARARGIKTATGIFQARMEVTLINSGPVTLLCESPPHSNQSS